MIVLALDLGTQTGWAVARAEKIISGSVSFATNKLAGFGVRFLNFRNWLVEMLRQHAIDTVVFEDVRNHAGVYAAHAYGGFVAILTSVCEALKIPYRGFGVKTIKKFITGSGNAGKQDVINAVQTKGYNPIDDNEADAIALMLLAENTFIKENINMYSNNIIGNTDNHKASFRNGPREVEIHKTKNSIDRGKISVGPCKYSQVTGRSCAAYR